MVPLCALLAVKLSEEIGKPLVAFTIIKFSLTVEQMLRKGSLCSIVQPVVCLHIGSRCGC